MNSYVVTACIELEAENIAEAETIVMDLWIYDEHGLSIKPTYIEIKEVKEI